MFRASNVHYYSTSGDVHIFQESSLNISVSHIQLVSNVSKDALFLLCLYRGRGGGFVECDFFPFRIYFCMVGLSHGHCVNFKQMIVVVFWCVTDCVPCITVVLF